MFENLIIKMLLYKHMLHIFSISSIPKTYAKYVVQIQSGKKKSYLNSLCSYCKQC